MDTLVLARYFANFLINYGALDTEIIDTKGNSMFNYLVVCTANDKFSAQNILVQLLEYAKNEFNQISLSIEGYKKADWIIVDFGKIVVHIFLKETRDKYNMEKIWR